MEPAELLRSVRRRHGLTQADLARLARTSQPVISAYERGRRDPTYGTLRRLVAATGEQVQIEARRRRSDLPPPADLREHGQRLVSVLSLVDAIPRRRQPPPLLDAPRLVST